MKYLLFNRSIHIPLTEQTRPLRLTGQDFVISLVRRTVCEIMVDLGWMLDHNMSQGDFERRQVRMAASLQSDSSVQARK